MQCSYLIFKTIYKYLYNYISSSDTMQLPWMLILLPIAAKCVNVLTPIIPTTADRIVVDGYPVEEHTTHTVDGYKLTMFRIPYSPKTQNENFPKKRAIFMQHGVVSSSDAWVLGGPKSALAYLAADAGYDVWLGNFRGNTYSNSHITLSVQEDAFWAFSFHENAIYDLPAALDYILKVNGKDSLHYVGHSMGTTALMILLSLRPEYSERIYTSHLLAPVVYTEHQKSAPTKASCEVLGVPNPASLAYSNHSIVGYNELISLFGAHLCSEELVKREVCGNILFLIGGFSPEQMNYDLLPDIVHTHPNGGSSNQLIHFCQLRLSGEFREFDHGPIENKIRYGELTPPDYPLERVRADPPIQLYYSDGDLLSSSTDVLRLPPRMGENIELQKVKYSTWNHFDYMWALQVKEVINDKILAFVDKYEN